MFPDPRNIQSSRSMGPQGEVDPKDAEIARLKSQLAEVEGNGPEAAGDSESPAETATDAPIVSQVPALAPGAGMSDPAITLSQIEPGLKWAVQNGLTTVEAAVEKYGEHMRKLFEGIM